MPDRPKVGFVTLAGTDFDYEWARSVFRQTSEALASQVDADWVQPPDLVITPEDLEQAVKRLGEAGVCCLVVQNGTFAWGGHIVGLAESLNVPVLLWALPEPEKPGKLRSNSLCGVNMNASALRKLGRFYHWLYLSHNSSEAYAQVGQFVRAAQVVKRLRRTRIALVGYRTPGFYGSTFDELGLRQRIGVEVFHIDLSEVKGLMERASDARADEWTRPLKQLGSGANMDEQKWRALGRLCCALARAGEEKGCTAFAVKCWPEAAALFGVEVCAALSLLTNRGTICGCEADVLGTVTMLIQYYLTGLPPFIVDFVHADYGRNVGVLWHCGNAPLSFAQDNVDTDNGMLRFGCKEGFVTFARLSQWDGSYRMILTHGRALAEGMVFEGTCASVAFATDVKRLLRLILDEGFEHHFSIVYADVVAELRLIARMLGAELREPPPLEGETRP